ncbi:Hypothetical protein PBC10988_23210 [Planctomycetales bacterium 10988]|nr:Hypothetical protein PBC10988_23210 [Planctomycetales bacterium 10988]
MAKHPIKNQKTLLASFFLMLAIVPLAHGQKFGWLPDKADEAREEVAQEIPEANDPGPYGWAGPVMARIARQQVSEIVPAYKTDPEELLEAQGKRMVLWIFTKFLRDGKNLPTYRQQIGDCVSFGTSNALQYSLAAYLVAHGGEGRLRQPYPPWIYGASRVWVASRRLGNRDGSTGSWASAAVQRYGVIASDHTNVPAYSGAIAKAWGYKGPDESFKPLAAKYQPEARLVTTWDQLCEAISKGYAIAVCSGQGFQMRPVERNARLEGIPSGSWPHCMAFIGYDDRSGREAAYCLNSWGETAHGRPQDYERLDGAPPGGFWIDKKTVERMLSGRDSYCYSFTGFSNEDDPLFPLGIVVEEYLYSEISAHDPIDDSSFLPLLPSPTSPGRFGQLSLLPLVSEWRLPSTDGASAGTTGLRGGLCESACPCGCRTGAICRCGRTGQDGPQASDRTGGRVDDCHDGAPRALQEAGHLPLQLPRGEPLPRQARTGGFERLFQLYLQRAVSAYQQAASIRVAGK